MNAASEDRPGSKYSSNKMDMGQILDGRPSFTGESFYRSGPQSVVGEFYSNIFGILNKNIMKRVFDAWQDVSAGRKNGGKGGYKRVI